jgi:hypothetical protein
VDEPVKAARANPPRAPPSSAHVPPGDAEDAPAFRRQSPIARTVVLEGLARGVEGVAVELDDQPLLSPGGVDLHSLDDGVRLRARQVVCVEEGEEAGLELASG